MIPGLLVPLWRVPTAAFIARRDGPLLLLPGPVSHGRFIQAAWMAATRGSARRRRSATSGAGRQVSTANPAVDGGEQANTALHPSLAASVRVAGWQVWQVPEARGGCRPSASGRA